MKLLEICARIALLACLACFPVGAMAQNITVAQGIACDEARQVESFAAKWNGENAPQALEAVNAEPGNKPDSCVITTFAFVERETVNARFIANKAPYRIVEIELVAIPHPFTGQWVDVSAQHVVWFTAIPITGERGA